MSATVAILLLALGRMLGPVPPQTPRPSRPVAAAPSVPPRPPTRREAEACRSAARAALGSHAVVLQCGRLTGGNKLETIGYVPIPRAPRDGDGLRPASTVAFLRDEASGWRIELLADSSWMRNQVGFLADAGSAPHDPEKQREWFGGHVDGWRVSVCLPDCSDSPPPELTLSLVAISPAPVWADEGVGYQVSWNPDVQRFEDWDYRYSAYINEVPYLPGASILNPLGKVGGARISGNRGGKR